MGVGSLGVSLNQISDAVRAQLQLPVTENVNIMFGPVSSAERELSIPFTAETAGRAVQGRVVFSIVETSARQWGGSAILLDSRVEIQ
jgi:hypothetical protein